MKQYKEKTIDLFIYIGYSCYLHWQTYFIEILFLQNSQIIGAGQGENLKQNMK